MRPALAIAVLALIAVGCSSSAPVASPASATTPVSDLPGLGDFAEYVSIAPTTQRDANFQIYKVNTSYAAARRFVYDALWKSGWTAKGHVQIKQMWLDSYVKPGSGRYILNSQEFDGPNTCTLEYSTTDKNPPKQ